MGMVSRGAMKYSCVSLYPVFMRTLSCFTAICSVRQCYRGVDLVLMRQELWHPHYEQNWCAALPLPFGCVCTHMTWKTFWVLTALQSVTHTLHSHDLQQQHLQRWEPHFLADSRLFILALVTLFPSASGQLCWVYPGADTWAQMRFLRKCMCAHLCMHIFLLPTGLANLFI